MWRRRGCCILIAILQIQILRACKKEEHACNWHDVKSNTTFPICNFKDDHLVCYGGLENNSTKGESVRTLVLCYWPQEEFDPENILKGFPSLRKLVVANGNLTKLTSPFPPETRLLEKVSMVGTKIQEISEQTFVNLPDLRSLDLRNNALANVNIKAFDIPSLQHVHLAGNPLRCTEETVWILNRDKSSLAHKVSDKDKLRCAGLYDGRPVVPVVEIIKRLKEECTKTICDCELVYIVGGKHVQKQLMAFVSVNCSHRYLTEMPNFLPANTTTLWLSGNKINDLSPLTTNPTYKGVIDLYLDDNLVESIVKLEGSYWLDHFRILNLRGNKLIDLPTYALENVLSHSGNAARLYLGNNPWRCDCHFTPGFQDLLIRYTNLIKDNNDVKCSLLNGDDNAGKPIRDLTRTEICISPDEDAWLHPLDVLNIILALLILLVIGKLLYDYWSFKKTGQLPWIVAKIP